jgi:SAM-dependent methyltransferase
MKGGAAIHPSIIDYARFGWQVLTGFRTRGERRIAEERRSDLAPHLDRKRSRRVLDLANGRLQPQCALLRAEGYRTFGVDRVNRSPQGLTGRGDQLARWIYRRHIPQPGPLLAPHGLIGSDVESLPFRDESFDFITSVAAFEHFRNVPRVLEEMRRVLRKGGLAWIRIHLFTSISGGHNVNISEIPLRHIPAGVDPWDHLRRRKRLISVPLNEWRRDQYLEAFGRYFEIVKHYCAGREGEEFLTPAIEAELSAYDRDELTCGAYVIVARRRP